MMGAVRSDSNRFVVPVTVSRSDTGRTMTPGARKALEAMARWGHRKAAAQSLGISLHTLRNHLRIAFEALDVHTITDAYRAMGWLDESRTEVP